jgi:hypothetical protein
MTFYHNLLIKSFKYLINSFYNFIHILIFYFIRFQTLVHQPYIVINKVSYSFLYSSTFIMLENLCQVTCHIFFYLQLIFKQNL